MLRTVAHHQSVGQTAKAYKDKKLTSGQIKESRGVMYLEGSKDNDTVSFGVIEDAEGPIKVLSWICRWSWPLSTVFF